MRVLHVLEATLGGTRRYVEDIANANLGCQMGLAYSLERADPQFSQTLSRIREMGWSTYEIPMMREINWRADLASLAAFRRISESFKPTVIHGHSSKAGAICRIVPRTRQSKARVVYSPHAIASDLGVVYRVAERVLALRTERFVAVSASERQQLLALGLADGSRIDVASPVVDGSEFLARDKGLARRVLDLNGSLTLVSVGRLSDQKNPLEFFNIAYGLRKYYPSLCAIWVGDGELRGRLESRIAETESEAWFRIAGWKVDTRDYIASADLVLKHFTV